MKQQKKKCKFKPCEYNSNSMCQEPLYTAGEFICGYKGEDTDIEIKKVPYGSDKSRYAYRAFVDGKQVPGIAFAHDTSVLMALEHKYLQIGFAVFAAKMLGLNTETGE